MTTATSSSADVDIIVRERQELSALRPLTLAACVALLGAGVGVVLTLVKFFSDYSCRHSYFSGCKVGEQAGCEEAFNSSMGSFFGAPTTIYATAFYVTAFFACAAVRKSPRDPKGWRLIAAIAAADVAVTVFMAGYAALVLHLVCVYCSVLYGVSLLFAALVFLGYRRRPQGPSRGRAPLSRWASVATVFPVALGTQAAGYGAARNRGVAEGDCLAPMAALPDSSLREPASEARFLLAEFVDPSCAHCRSQFEKLKALKAEPAYRDTLEVKIYHYPRDGAERCTPSNATARSAAAAANQACLASLAVQCVERLSPGHGLEMLEATLALQGTSPPWFTYSKLGAVASGLGIDPDVLAECMRKDAVVEATVRGHVGHGAAAGIRDTPRLFVVPLRDGAPAFDEAMSIEGDKDVLLLRHLVSAR